MGETDVGKLDPGPETAGTLSLEATDVTGMVTITADVQRTLPAGAVAKALASRMSLPDNVPWTLREDQSSALLDDERAIGDQVTRETGARLTVVPKAHLGAAG